MNQVRRRQFLIAVGAGGLMASLSALAQQPSMPRVGILSAGTARSSEYDAFFQGMRELGYTEGRNVAYEWRFGASDFQRLAAATKELAQLNVAVIISVEAGIAAASKVTNTIPIVMAAAADPVGSGYAKSLAKPGGNITGLSSMIIEIAPKQLELLRVALPKLSRVAVLLGPGNPTYKPILESLRSMAQKMGVRVFVAEAESAASIEAAFAEMKRQRVEALIVPRHGLFSNVRQGYQVAELAGKAHLPAIYTGWEFAGDGLMSYASSLTEIKRRAATFVDKILKGAKPGDLPIEQPTKFELVINRKAAKEIGLAIPQELLLRADRVIE